MITHMRSATLLALTLAVAPAVGAQSIFDSELRLAPQFMQYQVKAPSNETISEFALPVFVSIPFGSQFTFDVGTSYARARVTSGSALSEINGLTDTQLRGNYTLGNDFMVLTAGLNLPTGRSSVTTDQQSAAGRIGSDFLAFPISNMGTGLAVTAGIAVARPMGDWNVGFGGAVRHSASYDPFDVPGQPVTQFTPGDEYRARIGVDRGIFAGRMSLGLTYSAFGSDKVAQDGAQPFPYNTGNRLIAQAIVTNSIAGSEVTFAGYNVFRNSGLYASGDPAGHENILNGYVGVGINMLGTLVEPSVELRQWLQNIPGVTVGTTTTAERSQSSYLGTIGLRTRIAGLGFTAYPSAGYTIGKLAANDAAGAPVQADLTGFKAQLAVRIAP
ncbi:MAG: hypothetical protein M3Z05_09135 [Gemmatimonadota bacterium]|nr:hypothetical protein [Gemmatimonadota bacterium]